MDRRCRRDVAADAGMALGVAGVRVMLSCVASLRCASTQMRGSPPPPACPLDSLPVAGRTRKNAVAVNAKAGGWGRKSPADVAFVVISCVASLRCASAAAAGLAAPPSACPRRLGSLPCGCRPRESTMAVNEQGRHLGEELACVAPSPPPDPCRGAFSRRRGRVSQACGPSSFWPSSQTSGTPPRLVTLNSSRHRSRSSTPSPMSRPAPASMRASTSSARP